MSWLIYKHTNKTNGKSYIGQTRKKNPNYRWNYGKGYTTRNPDSHFARAIKKYGWDSFEHEIIEKNIETQDEANKRETFWIQYFDSVNNGYNANYGGNAIGEISDETRLKISKNSKEIWSKKGDEIRKIFASKEHRDKLSKSIKKSFESNINLKKQISEKRKQMIVITNGIETKTIYKTEYESYKKDNWQRGSVFISSDILSMMVHDYNHPKDLSISEVSLKYGFDTKIIVRAFKGLGIEIKKKYYRTWEKTRGVPKSDEHRKNISDFMKSYRKGKIWVNRDGISKSIFASDEMYYLNDGWKRGRGHINSINMTHESTRKKVKCVETNTIYDCINDASRITGINKRVISAVCNKKPHYNTAGGYHWVFVE